MIFASIDVDIIMHEKALAAGLEAFGLWSWCMCWTQKYATDGRIPAVAIASALNSKPREMRRALDRLVSSGLLVVSPDGSYLLFNYGKKNQTAEEIRRKKDLAAERVRAWRERRSNAPVTPQERVTECARTDPEPEPSPEPDNTTRKQKTESAPRVVGADGDSGQLFGAWSEGIREATGIPQSGLSPGDRRELVAIANTHAGGATGQALLDWARSTAIAFAKAHDPTYGGFVPLQARKWLDGGRRERTGNGAPRQPIGSAASAPWMTPTNFDFGASK